MEGIVQIIAGFIGSLGFGILFNVRGKRLVVAALGGLVAWALYLVLGFILPDEAVRYFIVSAALALYSEIMARLLKTPTTTFLMTSLIPLIPGGGLYYTMTNAFTGEMEGFLSRGIVTLSLAVALALGVIVVTVVFNLINKYKNKRV